VASRIHALPSGREDLEGLPDEDGPRPDLNRVHFEADLDSTRPGRPGQLTATLAPGRHGSGPFHRSLRYQLVLGDGLAASTAWVFAAIVAGDTGGTRQLACALAAVVATMMALRRAGLYRSHVCNLPSRQAVRVVASATFGTVVYLVCGWLAGSVDGVAAVAGLGLSTALILTVRWRFGRWLKARRSVGQHLRRTLLIGTNDDAISLWNMLSEEPELGYRVVGVVGPTRGDAPWGLLTRCVDTRDLPDLARRTGADGVIITAGAFDARTTAAIVRQAQDAGLHVQVWPAFMGVSSARVRFAPESGIPVFYVERSAAPGWQEAAKRTLDIVITLAISPVVLPVLVAAAICIKLEDRGPVLYHQTVVGRHGAPATVLKLRTMVPNASRMLANLEAMNERTGGPLFKASNDPRVTRIGRLLRATSIDELPQLWNVLTGTMSLVGPRPALPHEVANFDPELQRRHEMRPGITGLWQAEARDNPSFSAYRRLDLFYVDNWRLGLDLAILANTAHAVTVRALKGVVPSIARRASQLRPEDLKVHALTIPELAGAESARSE
jgi:exopolysaccharide biosynthesis polyprenyl glycosylphosphotransferase